MLQKYNVADLKVSIPRSKEFLSAEWVLPLIAWGMFNTKCPTYQQNASETYNEL